MPFHKDRAPSTTFVYQFTARQPVENLGLVDDQIFLAHRYYNKLVEIERERRDRYYEIVGKEPEVAEARREAAKAQDLYEQAAEADAEERKASRRRTTSDSTKAALKDLKEKSKAVKAAERKVAKVDRVKALLKTSDTLAHDAVKAARKACEVYWGTYLITERSCPNSGPPPRFRRWDKGGQVAVQIQKGATEEELLAGSNVAKLELRDDWGRTRRASKYGTLWMRIGSDGRKPVWTKIPIFYDRRLPEGGKVKWIQLIRRRRGIRLHWFVSMTIEVPGAALKATKLKQPTDLSKTLALDLGWRTLDNGDIRVAYGYDGDNSFEIKIPQWVSAGYKLVHDLRSIRDRAFNEVRDRLVEYLVQNTVSEEVKEALAYLPQWRSTARLGAVVAKWEDAPEWLEEWRQQDLHLYAWERNQDRKQQNWRQNYYRHWALWIARNYDNVLFEDLNIANIKRHAVIGEEKAEAIGPHVPASPGELRQQIRETCLRDGVAVHLVPSKNTTKTCTACGELGIKRREALRVRCSSCGAHHDQDCNAARMIHSFATGGEVADRSAPLIDPDGDWYHLQTKVPKRVLEREERLAAEAAEREAAVV